MERLCSNLAIYSFLGWLVEGIHHLWTCGSFKKPNFSWAPFKPMYGIAAILLLFVQKMGRKIFYLSAFILPSIVEYISGYWLEKSFHLRYWDYSQEKGNISGLICPKFSLYWGILSSITVHFIQPFLTNITTKKHWKNFRLAIVAIFFCDMLCNLCRRYHKA